MNTQEMERIIQLAISKLSYKDPNISLSLDRARYLDQHLVSVGCNGLYMSSRGSSFEEATRTLLDQLESMK